MMIYELNKYTTLCGYVIIDSVIVSGWINQLYCVVADTNQSTNGIQPTNDVQSSKPNVPVSCLQTEVRMKRYKKMIKFVE